MKDNVEVSGISIWKRSIVEHHIVLSSDNITSQSKTAIAQHFCVNMIPLEKYLSKYSELTIFNGT